MQRKCIGLNSPNHSVVRKINTARYEIQFPASKCQNIKHAMSWINFHEKWKLSETKIKPGKIGPKQDFTPRKK